jgi:regulator of sigma E protease
VIAFQFGVEQITATVGLVSPGGGAWQAGLKTGDEVVEVAGKPVKTFRDMQEAVMLGDVENGVPVTVKRPGVEKPIDFVVKTYSIGGRPGIGIVNSAISRLVKEKGVPPVLPGTPSSQTEPAFMPGDRFVKIDGRPIENYADIHAILGTHADKPLTVTVERAASKDAEAAADSPKEVTIRVEPNPMREFGLVMEIGEIKAIQKNSPAEKAGFQAGDILRTMNDKPIGDPMTLAGRLRAQVGKEVVFGVVRGSEKSPVQLKATLVESDQYSPPSTPNSAIAIPELGIAYKVLNTVQGVVENSPAAKADIKAGDVLRKATIFPPDKPEMVALREKYHQPELTQSEDSTTFDAEHLNWPYFMQVLQTGLPGTTVELRWSRGEEKQKATLEPVASTEWFNPNRGWFFEPKTVIQTAGSFGEAVKRGSQETLNATLVVFRSLQKIGSGQVSARNLGGPVTIFRVAQSEAERGIGNLLLFLTLLSANLAVVNFLPIPVLDGGHLVLLLWEGIRGKPADERVQEVLTYIGLLAILTLMVFVLGLDFNLISRPG